MMKFLFIFLGGGLGAACRYACGFITWAGVPNFPWSTLFVNLLGSFLIGFAVVLFGSGFLQQNILWLFFVVGFLGGFTTFSAFSLDLFLMLEARSYVFFLWNILLNVAGGLICLALGNFCAKSLSG